jgi:hypothetical protein
MLGPSDVSVTVSPAGATLAPLQTQQFTATVTGTANTAVTWSLALGEDAPPGADPGAIEASGLYSAPASVPVQYTVTVTARSQADASKTATASVTLSPPPPAPTNLSATAQAGPQVTVTWRDNATNETGFILNRCSFVTPATTCTVFAQIATVGPRAGTGTVIYIDTTVLVGNNYRYQVAAFNAAGNSAFATLPRAVVVQAIPPAPTSLIVSAVPAGTSDTATLTWTAVSNPNSFTIQRATDLDFTIGLTSTRVSGAARSLNQTVNQNTVYYYRISAANSTGGASAWTNAVPFPILTP